MHVQPVTSSYRLQHVAYSQGFLAGSKPVSVIPTFAFALLIAASCYVSHGSSNSGPTLVGFNFLSELSSDC